MEQATETSEAPKIHAGERIVVLNWRTGGEEAVVAISNSYWDYGREHWAFDYLGFPERPGYAVWNKDHWEDGEY